MRHLIVTASLLVLAACVPSSAVTVSEVVEQEDPLRRENYSYIDTKEVSLVGATAETAPVDSQDDAADDPAIWIHPTDPERSLILGTDKQAGIAVYGLNGELRQFLAIGEPNNVDVRQGVLLNGSRIDIAVASNRLNDTISVMSVNASGVKLLGEFPSLLPEPYGICVGQLDNQTVVFVTYKTGHLLAHRLSSAAQDQIRENLVGQVVFSGQLEGCVVDDSRGTLFVGEEERAIWRTALRWTQQHLLFSYPHAVDLAGSETGIVADLEGVALYTGHEPGKVATYLVVSSQGNDSFAVYEAGGENGFIGRFRIGSGAQTDGAQETDGIAVTAASLGHRFPRGLLVVQDGFNAPAGSPQNFKIVDWREVERILGK